MENLADIVEVYVEVNLVASGNRHGRLPAGKRVVASVIGTTMVALRKPMPELL